MKGNLSLRWVLCVGERIFYKVISLNKTWTNTSIRYYSSFGGKIFTLCLFWKWVLNGKFYETHSAMYKFK